MKRFIYPAILLPTFFAVASVVHAQPSLLPACTYSGNCGVCDIIDMVGRVYEFLLWGLGATLFLLFSWGAFELVNARGNAEKVEKAKSFITGTLWGGFFVLIAWQMINVTLFILGTSTSENLSFGNGGEKAVFRLFDTNPWNYVCGSGNVTVGEGSEIDKKNSAQCFSMGDGSPCDFYAANNSTSKGHCQNGKCVSGFACDWLRDNDPGGIFKGFKCTDQEADCDKIGQTDSSKWCECISGLCSQGILCCRAVDKAL